MGYKSSHVNIKASSLFSTCYCFMDRKYEAIHSIVFNIVNKNNKNKRKSILIFIVSILPFNVMCENAVNLHFNLHDLTF
jgi:hypothetical protein